MRLGRSSFELGLERQLQIPACCGPSGSTPVAAATCAQDDKSIITCRVPHPFRSPTAERVGPTRANSAIRPGRGEPILAPDEVRSSGRNPGRTPACHGRPGGDRYENTLKSCFVIRARLQPGRNLLQMKAGFSPCQPSKPTTFVHCEFRSSLRRAGSKNYHTHLQVITSLRRILLSC